ncbi:hypothetical protein GQ55_2G051200 [Panicum hallii var. hallii]|uniref:Uncharacterized protein n=1 Tax=Panicum hallii var. hallii TaxID=1504633 RepID=A0A2T7ELL3_9POAL|nr:hypothetical protein GQ55_2G051200 [Panicum hallii var. hallii]
MDAAGSVPERRKPGDLLWTWWDRCWWPWPARLTPPGSSSSAGSSPRAPSASPRSSTRSSACSARPRSTGPRRPPGRSAPPGRPCGVRCPSSSHTWTEDYFRGGQSIAIDVLCACASRPSALRRVWWAPGPPRPTWSTAAPFAGWRRTPTARGAPRRTASASRRLGCRCRPCCTTGCGGGSGSG